jgi:hypothetical protein
MNLMTKRLSQWERGVNRRQPLEKKDKMNSTNINIILNITIIVRIQIKHIIIGRGGPGSSVGIATR